jgi:hypothetical protein
LLVGLRGICRLIRLNLLPPVTSSTPLFFQTSPLDMAHPPDTFSCLVLQPIKLPGAHRKHIVARSRSSHAYTSQQEAIVDDDQTNEITVLLRTSSANPTSIWTTRASPEVDLCTPSPDSSTKP